MAVIGILLDTNAYAAFKRGTADAVEIVRTVPLITLNSIILGEILGGFAAGAREIENRQELRAFLGSERVKNLVDGLVVGTRLADLYTNRGFASA